MRPELPVLIKARDKIVDPANWGKGIRGVNALGGRRPLNTCCAAEAVEDVCDDYGLRGRAFRALRSAIGIAPDRMSGIAMWNDDPDTTHAEVLAAFDRAIESLQNQPETVAETSILREDK